MSIASSVAALSPSGSLAATSATFCPLNAGVAIVDQLLAAITRTPDASGLDTALDFRLALAEPAAPGDTLRDFFRLRADLEEQHYLLCYRLRRWLENEFVAEVQVDRTLPAQFVPLKLESNTLRTCIERCVAEAAADRPWSGWSRVRFVRHRVAQTVLVTA